MPYEILGLVYTWPARVHKPSCQSPGFQDSPSALVPGRLPFMISLRQLEFMSLGTQVQVPRLLSPAADSVHFRISRRRPPAYSC